MSFDSHIAWQKKIIQGTEARIAELRTKMFGLPYGSDRRLLTNELNCQQEVLDDAERDLVSLQKLQRLHTKEIEEPKVTLDMIESHQKVVDGLESRLTVDTGVLAVTRTTSPMWQKNYDRKHATVIELSVARHKLHELILKFDERDDVVVNSDGSFTADGATYDLVPVRRTEVEAPRVTVDVPGSVGSVNSITLIEQDKHDQEPSVSKVEQQKVEVSFHVEIRDDHDGGSVWFDYDEEEFATQDEADREAPLVAQRRSNHVSRVVKVTREVVSVVKSGGPTIPLPPFLKDAKYDKESDLLTTPDGEQYRVHCYGGGGASHGTLDARGAGGAGEVTIEGYGPGGGAGPVATTVGTGGSSSIPTQQADGARGGASVTTAGDLWPTGGGGSGSSSRPPTISPPEQPVVNEQSKLDKAATRAFTEASEESGFYDYDAILIVFDRKTGAYEFRCSKTNVTMAIGLMHRAILNLHKEVSKDPSSKNENTKEKK